MSIRWKNQIVEYAIPNVNQCKVCHQDSAPIGPTARNLNRADQLEQWTKAGYLKGAPHDPPRMAVWNDPATGTIAQRARAYLDVNCATCHKPGDRAGDQFGIYLGLFETNPSRLGACKPGFMNTVESVEPKVRMPNLGRSVVDREAVQLLRAWQAEACAGS